MVAHSCFQQADDSARGLAASPKWRSRRGCPSGLVHSQVPRNVSIRALLRSAPVPGLVPNSEAARDFLQSTHGNADTACSLTNPVVSASGCSTRFRAYLRGACLRYRHDREARNALKQSNRPCVLSRKSHVYFQGTPMCTFKEMSGLHGYLALPTSGRRTEFRPRLPHIGGDLDSSDVLFRASELRNRACVLSRKVMCTLKEIMCTLKEIAGIKCLQKREF